MPGHLGTQYKDWSLDAILGANFTPATEVGFALYPTDPGPTGGGSTEITGNNYSRPVYDNDDVTWADATGATKSNAITINFPTPTGGDWGAVTHFGVWDVDSGFVIFTGPLGSPVTILAGQPVSFPPGSLTFQAEDV